MLQINDIESNHLNTVEGLSLARAKSLRFLKVYCVKSLVKVYLTEIVPLLYSKRIGGNGNGVEGGFY